MTHPYRTPEDRPAPHMTLEEVRDYIASPAGEKRPDERLADWLRRLRVYTRPFPSVDAIVCDALRRAGQPT